MGAEQIEFPLGIGGWKQHLAEPDLQGFQTVSVGNPGCCRRIGAVKRDDIGQCLNIEPERFGFDDLFHILAQPFGPLVKGDLESAIRTLKAEREGEIEVAGPKLAQSLAELGLIDEYRIYLHPVVLGHGTPLFAGPRPPLHLMATERIGADVIRLTYVPA